jgi:hypothetical protein
MFVVTGPWQTTAVRRRVDAKAARANVKDTIRSPMDTLQIAKRQLVGYLRKSVVLNAWR